MRLCASGGEIFLWGDIALHCRLVMLLWEMSVRCCALQGKTLQEETLPMAMVQGESLQGETLCCFMRCNDVVARDCEGRGCDMAKTQRERLCLESFIDVSFCASRCTNKKSVNMHSVLTMTTWILYLYIFYFKNLCTSYTLIQ